MSAMEGRIRSISPQEKPSEYKLFKVHYLSRENNHDLVVSPTNYQKVLGSVKERALYGDSCFPEVNRKLQIVTEEELVASKATWHHICYQRTTKKELN